MGGLYIDMYFIYEVAHENLPCLWWWMLIYKRRIVTVMRSPLCWHHFTFLFLHLSWISVVLYSMQPMPPPPPGMDGSYPPGSAATGQPPRPPMSAAPPVPPVVAPVPVDPTKATAPGQPWPMRPLFPAAATMQVKSAAFAWLNSAQVFWRVLICAFFVCN